MIFKINSAFYLFKKRQFFFSSGTQQKKMLFISTTQLTLHLPTSHKTLLHLVFGWSKPSTAKTHGISTQTATNKPTFSLASRRPISTMTNKPTFSRFQVKEKRCRDEGDAGDDWWVWRLKKNMYVLTVILRTQCVVIRTQLQKQHLRCFCSHGSVLIF